MKAIMVMYDSLNRELIESYGCDWTLTPNFKRLAEKAVQFENCYVGSMPCMPARRELHTGRVNFFHRSWGPLEPFDDSMPELLKNNGIYSHLISDHQHYWEDGGATYHQRYSSWEIVRGQEGDSWKADLAFNYDKESVFKNKNAMKVYPQYVRLVTQDAINRENMQQEDLTCQAVTFQNGIDFIDKNHEQDNWFLQVETFDPHEPFFTLKDENDLFQQKFTGDADLEYDWPPYAPVAEDEETVNNVRYTYASLLSKCDRYLGKILDAMDKYNLWDDTMLIVNTDHGFLLGEHGWWGKSAMPLFNEIAHTPLYVYDPRRKDKMGCKRNSIVQTIDIAPTLLDFFKVDIPKDMQGKPLTQVIEDDTPIREYAVYGYFGSQVNVTDGRYVYMHSADNPDMPLYEYTLMPTHMRAMFSTKELQNTVMAEPFEFTKSCPVMKIRAQQILGNSNSFGSALYDLQADKTQNTLIENDEVTEKMKSYISKYMNYVDAPSELYDRLGISKS